MVVTPAPVSSMPSCLTVANPDRVNVTTYVPGFRSTIRYWPVPSVTTVRDFSMSAGLDASTLTPGRIAPDESLTIPATAGWENAGAERTSSAVMTRDPIARTRIDGLLSCRHPGVDCSDRRSLWQAEAVVEMSRVIVSCGVRAPDLPTHEPVHSARF